MKWVIVQPSDVWFFRDGRPYAAGQGQTAGTIFPPTPLTVQGAFRSLLLGRSDVGWREFYLQQTAGAQALGEQIGYPALVQDREMVRAADLGQFKMQGPLLARWVGDRVEWLVPMPQDAYMLADETTSEKTRSTWQALQPARNPAPDDNWTNWPGNASSFTLQPAAAHDEDEPAERGWLDPDSLADYLDGVRFRPLFEPLFEAEPRLGIGLDYTRKRPRDGYIYQPLFRRPANPEFGVAEPGLLVQLADDVMPDDDTGLLMLGGESRAAHYQVLTDEQAPPPVPTAEPTTRLKVVLLTPAWFDGGWQPAGGNWSQLFDGRDDIKLVAAAVGRPLHIGGWDVANNAHKPMRACVSAGSVYYFEAASPIAPPAQFTQTPDGRLSFPAQGFGVCASGVWQWLENDQSGGQ